MARKRGVVGLNSQNRNLPPVILVHGVGLDRTMWRGVEAALDGTVRYRSFDLPCHGVQPIPSGKISLRTFSDALAGEVDQAPEKPVVVGFSMGAMIAQRFALDHPDAVCGLVLMNAVFDRNEEQRAAILQRLETAKRDGPGTMTDAALARWFTPEFTEANPGIIESVRQRLLSNDPAAYLAAYSVFATGDTELTNEVHRISCPTLVMTAEGDQNSTPAMTEALAARIPGALALVLDGVAHGAPVEDPNRTADALLAFLTELDT